MCVFTHAQVRVYIYNRVRLSVCVSVGRWVFIHTCMCSHTHVRIFKCNTRLEQCTASVHVHGAGKSVVPEQLQQRCNILCNHCNNATTSMILVLYCCSAVPPLMQNHSHAATCVCILLQPCCIVAALLQSVRHMCFPPPPSFSLPPTHQ